MKNVGIYFVSQYGQTAKIAREIAVALEKKGIESVRYDVNYLSVQSRLRDHDAYIICGAMYAGKYKRKLVTLLARNRDILSMYPTAFVSVSLSAGGSDFQKGEAAVVAEKLFHSLVWRPDFLFNVAGAVSYPEYGFLKRIVMKRICQKSRGPIDTQRVHELTDWDDVAKFALDFAHLDPKSPYCFRVNENLNERADRRNVTLLPARTW